MTEESIGTEYLGDGVYASFEYGQVKLATERADGRHVIFLEKEVMDRLINYVKEKGMIR